MISQNNGYTGSNDLEDMLKGRLNRDNQIRGIDVTYKNGTVTLTGNASSYYIKQLSQERIRGLDGVVDIVNEVEVIPGRKRDY